MSVKYTTLERIAVGGMGEVFLARQEGMGGFRRTVVLKRLLPDVESDDDSMRRFLDEARVAAALSHENVVSILEVGEDNGPFLALEYVHGENAGQLRQKARKKQIRFPIVVVARIIADAARGLAHAHDAVDVEGRPLHIVHRDVAPKNIFVRADGVSKIGDFGIAKSEHRLSKTATGQVPGTLSYMAPEQSAGDETSPASDQFSLGIALWELLTGEPLFKAPSPQETLRNILTKHISRPSKKREDALPLDGIVLRMLDRDPAKRFRSLADAAVAIESVLPETRAELGQKAVAMFVEAVAGDELRERQKRIEQGPDATLRIARDHPLIGSESSSDPFKTPSATPATISARTDQATRPDRGVAPLAPAVATSIAPAAPPSRTRFAAVLTGLAMVCAVGVVGAAVEIFRGPSNDERTADYLDDAVATNPLTHREFFLAMAELENADTQKLAPVADQMAALAKERLTALRAGKSDAGFLDKARAVLKSGGVDGDLAENELDMWDYDSSAPMRWMDPDPPNVIQQTLQQGALEYMHALTPIRRIAVDRLIARSGVDAKTVHAALDPLVNERVALIERSATAPPAELVDLDRKIARLKRDGDRKMTALCGAPCGHALARAAFHTVSSPDEWDPLFEMPPSTAAEKAAGHAAPETH